MCIIYLRLYLVELCIIYLRLYLVDLCIIYLRLYLADFSIIYLRLYLVDLLTLVSSIQDFIWLSLISLHINLALVCTCMYLIFRLQII